MDKVIRFEKVGSIGVLTLNRPGKGNAIDVAMADTFLEMVLECDADPHVRAVVVTGTGKTFCVGGDVEAFSAAGNAMPALVKRLTAPLHTGMARLARMEKPLVTAVNGAAAGAGFGLAISGDVVLAARSARFVAAYGALGLTPDAGLTWLLPRLIGLRQAQRIAIEGLSVDAIEAERIGLISRSVDDESLMSEAMTIAAKLADGAVAAMGRTRALLVNGFSTSFENQLEDEAQAISRCAGGEEAKEGLAAFLSRRPPTFN